MRSPMSAQERHFWGNLEKRIRTEWAVATVLLMALTAALSYFSSNVGLIHIEHTFYDQALALDTGAPDDDHDIIIIAIDDDSLEHYGYWSWRRALHARLLDHLHEAKVVGIDIVFNDTNPAYPEDDSVLAQAIAHHGRVVLPTHVSNDRSEIIMPLPELAAAAKNLGYINAFPSSDGVVRGLRAVQTLSNGASHHYFLAAMLAAAGNYDAYSHFTAYGETPLLIPYSGPPGRFNMVPYTKVMDGLVPAATFRGKYVLIGSWGTGLGDAFPTPVSRDGEAMSGVEIMANSLLSALRDRWIQSPSSWQLALLSCLPVLLSCLVIPRLSPRRSLIMTLGTLLSVMLIALGLLHYVLVWMPVTPSLIGVALAYPIWNWRSQETALQTIDEELVALNEQRQSLYRSDSHIIKGERNNSLPTRISQLHNAISQLRDAQQKREETLRFLSHDMRSPQNSILALTQLQRNTSTSIPVNQLLDRIDQYANRTLVLVDGFVQFARADAARMARDPLNLSELLTQCADYFWAIAQHQHIEIVEDDSPGDAWILGDSAMLARTFSNLLDNALKYSPPNTTITWSVIEAKDSWTVRIQDQGRGMRQDQLKSLFVPFSRLEGDAPDNPAGAGLGLAFVKTVIHRHGGSIRVESAKGEGSTFIVNLPAFRT